MRDIRNDLVERIASIKEEKGELQNRLSALDELETDLSKVLRQEEARHGSEQRNLFSHSGNGQGGELRGFLRSAMGDGGVWTIPDLKRVALERNFEIDSDSPGRSIQGILMVMKKEGEIESLGEGKWEIAS